MLSGRQGACGARHVLPVERRPSDGRLAEGHAAAARQTLACMAEAPGRPGAMGAFDALFAGERRREAIEADARKVVGYFCNFVPDELVLAAGAIPLRLDLGHGASAEAGGRLLAADVCPEVRALMGAHLGELPYMRHADLLVVPTACDGKKKLAWTLGEQREVWLMELPQSREGAASRRLWRDEVRALARRLQQLTGRRIRRRALREAVELVNRRSRLARRINELRFEDPRRLNGRDAFLVMQATFIADPGWWVERAGALVEEMEAADPPGDPPARGGPARVLLTGSPVLFPDFQLLQLVEESGAAVVVADEMCSGTQRLHNLTVLDETTVGGMIRAAADKTLMPCTCPCFVGGDLRVDRVLELAARSGAQGVIHHTLRLCQLYDLEAPRLAEALRRRGLPMLSLHTEYGGEGAATLRNRVEAFIEMLQQ